MKLLLAFTVFAPIAFGDDRLVAPCRFSFGTSDLVPASAVPPAMIWIPGGEFTMGSPLARPDERPLHRVHVDPFWAENSIAVLIGSTYPAYESQRCPGYTLHQGLIEMLRRSI